MVLLSADMMSCAVAVMHVCMERAVIQTPRWTHCFVMVGNCCGSNAIVLWRGDLAASGYVCSMYACMRVFGKCQVLRF